MIIAAYLLNLMMFSVELENYASSLEAFDRALNIAKEEGDKEAEVAITKAMEDVRGKLPRKKSMAQGNPSFSSKAD